MAIQLNLGCGSQLLDGFINVDSGDGVYGVNVSDIVWLIDFSADSVDLIYSAHALQCLPHRSDVQAALRSWHRVLKLGGKLILEVPTIVPLFKDYLSGKVSIKLLNQGIYGVDAEGLRQVVCFDLTYLTELLLEAGFTSVREVTQPSWSRHCAATNLVVESLK